VWFFLEAKAWLRRDCHPGCRRLSLCMRSQAADNSIKSPRLILEPL
jgi:hypothetical protein